MRRYIFHLELEDDLVAYYNGLAFHRSHESKPTVRGITLTNVHPDRSARPYLSINEKNNWQKELQSLGQSTEPRETSQPSHSHLEGPPAFASPHISPLS